MTPSTALSGVNGSAVFPVHVTHSPLTFPVQDNNMFIDDKPVLSPYVPEKHDAHELMPAFQLKVPVGHAIHTLELVAPVPV
jgi:hypothetical protein